MGKKEFLDILRTQLQGSLSQAEIEGHLHYYKEYISESVAEGKSEAQVLEELGSPVMIARTLIDSARAMKQEDSSNSSSHDPEEEEFHTGMKLPKWWIPVVIILALFFILSIVGKVVALAARFFVPIMVVVLIAALIKSRRES